MSMRRHTYIETQSPLSAWPTHVVQLAFRKGYGVFAWERVVVAGDGMSSQEMESPHGRLDQTFSWCEPQKLGF